MWIIWYRFGSRSLWIFLVSAGCGCVCPGRNYAIKCGWGRGRFVCEFSHHSETNGYVEHLAWPSRIRLSQQLVNYFFLLEYSQSFACFQHIHKILSSLLERWLEVNGVRLPESTLHWAGFTWLPTTRAKLSPTISKCLTIEMRNMSCVYVFLSGFLLGYIFILYLTYVGAFDMT